VDDQTSSNVTPLRQPRDEGDQPLPGAGREDVLADLERLLPQLEGQGVLAPGAAAVALALLRARVNLGVKRYGRRLETFNGRDAHLDWLAEAVDGIMYAHQAELERRRLDEENAGLRARLAAAEAQVAEALREAEQLRGVLGEVQDQVLALQATRDSLQADLERARAAAWDRATAPFLDPPLAAARRVLERNGHRVLVVQDPPRPKLEPMVVIDELADLPSEDVLARAIEAAAMDLTTFGRAGILIPPPPGRPEVVPQEQLEDLVERAKAVSDPEGGEG
jgi:multidrug efflux pump subunit AcrA (membrane-fusion protein)